MTGLTLGAFDLLGDGAGWTCEASGAGTSWGDAAPITQVMASFLADGAVETTSGHENRTLTVALRLKASDSTVLAEAEAALVSECVAAWEGAPNTLVWTPPGGAPACVFDVEAAALAHTFDSYAENYPSANGRSYTLTLTALPWCRSASTQQRAVATAGREGTGAASGLGSVPAPLSLQVSHPTASLGTVLLHSVPTRLGVQPPALRAVLQAGPAITADAAAVSGSTSPLTTQHVFTIPSAKVPSGTYQLLTRVKAAAAGSVTLSWTARALMGSTSSVPLTGATKVALAAGAWTVVPVALVGLPPRAMGSTGKVQVLLSSDVACTLDEAWLFNVTDGALTWVEAGSGSPTAGGASKVAAALAAGPDFPAPRIMLGNTASGSDWLAAVSEVSAFGVHEMDPGGVDVTTVTTNTGGTSTTATWFPCWHTHAAA